MKRLSVLIVLLASAGAAAQLNLLEGAKPKEPKVGLELLADHTGLVPGRSTGIAIAFDLEPEWHIYWRNKGEGGDEPRFKWRLPPGYEIGPLQWPAPHRHVDGEGDVATHTFILEGRPVLLTTLKVPADAPVGSEVTLTADAVWLICKEICIRGTRTLSLKLPVVSAEQAKAAHADLFAAARSRLPLPNDKAKYLHRLDARASVDKVRPGDTFKVAVVFDIQDGHHLNSHQPLDENLIPTDVFHDRADGVAIGRAEFPPGKVETTPHDEKLSVYRGRVAVILPIEADPVLEGKEIRISGIATYQACTDATQQCYPPTAAEWEVTIPTAGKDATVARINKDLAWVAAGAAPSGDGASPAPRPGGKSPTTQAASGSTNRPAGGPPPTSASILGRLQATLADWGLLGHLLMALIGGFLLNLMPCVLPVISIKILSFVQQAGENRIRVLTLGMAFSAGILVSFLALGVLIVMAGQQWGGLFQSPHVVIAMCAIVTAFALSLFGVFTLQPPRLVSNLGAKVQQEGHLNTFGMGLLATALGTACTAPFLGLVLALAARQTPAVGLLIFLFAGIGMAAPYVALAAHPAWLRVIPRPGPWMKTFENLMGFLLLGTVVWLLNSVNEQLGGAGLFWTIAFLVFVGAACWFYGKAEFGLSPARRLMFYSLALLAVAAGWVFSYSGSTRIARLMDAQNQLRRTLAGREQIHDLDWTQPDLPWRTYTRDKALETVKQGYTIFVDYTASWCANCKSNEKLFINTPEVRASMQELGVIPFKADFSNYDEEIKKDLEKYQRLGVPMYLIIPGGRPDDAILLDELLLSTAPIIDGLRKAGPSNPSGSQASTGEIARRSAGPFPR